jgi:hypothetical protein
MLGIRGNVSSKSGNGISRHFLREAKIMAALPWALILLAVLGALLIPRIIQFVKVDRCLDRGGSFNYQAHVCEGAKPNG